MEEKKKEVAAAEEWWGYRCKRLRFEDHDAILVFPREGSANGYLAVKTEYWNAFPEAVELPLMEKGFHLCYIRNDNRWGGEPDLERKARFIRYIQEEYQLKPQCVPVGMSCGGLIAMKLAGKYPELVGCLYLDAPVLNYMSCPCGFGIGDSRPAVVEELRNALGLESMAELMAYRDMPLDKLGILVEHRIPVVR